MCLETLLKAFTLAYSPPSSSHKVQKQPYQYCVSVIKHHIYWSYFLNKRQSRKFCFKKIFFYYHYISQTLSLASEHLSQNFSQRISSLFSCFLSFSLFWWTLLCDGRSLILKIMIDWQVTTAVCTALEWLKWLKL